MYFEDIEMDKEMEKVVHSTLGEPMPKGNSMEIFESGFDRFWSAWPKNPRKGAKSECRKKWDKLKCESDIDQIIKHIEWMKTTDQWKEKNGAYIPAPLVYINQMRWDGAEVPEIEITVSVAFKDPALRKIEEDAKKAAPIPDHVRDYLKKVKA